ncbi:MAG: hypothetical protein ACRD8U_17020, partial [Pyrinomonadaceae bacterium]
MKILVSTNLRLALAIASGVFGIFSNTTLPVPRAFAINQPQTAAEMPNHPVAFGAFVVQFDKGGTFKLEGKGWPSLSGTWKSQADEVALYMSGGPGGCDGPGRYRFQVDGKRIGFSLISDDCVVRRMILDRSIWLPVG